MGPDCGPREGAIRLLEKASGSTEETVTPTTPVTPFEEGPSQPHGILPTLREKLSRTFSISSRRASEVPQPIGSPSPAVPLSTTPKGTPRARSESRMSRANGSAYGYGGAYRKRLSSVTTRRGSIAYSIPRRRDSTREGDVPPSSVGTDMNFAQRLLMANENAVTNIADLWVAAAINADNEDPFEPEDEFVEEGEEDAQELGAFPSSMDILNLDTTEEGGTSTASPSVQHTNRFARSDSTAPLSLRSLSKRPSLGGAGSPRRPSSSAHPHRVSFNRYNSFGSLEEPYNVF